MAYTNPYEQKIIGLEEQKRTAEKLREMGMDTPQGQMVSGIYVAPSWTQYMSQALKQGMGSYQAKKAEEGIKAAQAERQAKVADIIRQMGQSTKTGETIPVDTGAMAQSIGMPQQAPQENPLLGPEINPMAPPQGALGPVAQQQPSINMNPQSSQIVQSPVSREMTMEERLPMLAELGALSPEAANLYGGYYQGRQAAAERAKETAGERAWREQQAATEHGWRAEDAATAERNARERLRLEHGYRVSEKTPEAPKTLETASGVLQWNPKTQSWDQVSVGGQPVKGKTEAKPLTESQGKAVSFGSRSLLANDTISDLENKVSPANVNATVSAGNIPLIGGLAGWGATAMASPDEQKMIQAQNDFITAILRRESGAVISEGEFNREAKKYFPQPGERPEVIAQKALARQTAIAALQAEAGDTGRANINEIVNAQRAKREQLQKTQSGATTSGW